MVMVKIDLDVARAAWRRLDEWMDMNRDSDDDELLANTRMDMAELEGAIEHTGHKVEIPECCDDCWS